MNVVVMLTGPTASGKSSVGLQIAKSVGGEIVNADSVQMYKDIPLLSSVPTDCQLVAHHLYQVIDGSVLCSVGRWLELARDSIMEIHNRNKIPIVLGGTPMYQRLMIDGIAKVPDIPSSVLQETRGIFAARGRFGLYDELVKLDPDVVDCIRPSDTYRIMRSFEILRATGMTFDEVRKMPRQSFCKEFKLIKICLLPARKKVYDSCESRFVSIMQGDGVICEIRNLLARELSSEMPVMKAIGVSEITDYINGDLPWQGVIDRVVKRTKNYAKRQYTWFNNSFEDFTFYDGSSEDKIVSGVLSEMWT